LTLKLITDDENDPNRGSILGYAEFLASRNAEKTKSTYDSGIRIILGNPKDPDPEKAKLAIKPDAFLEYARSFPKNAEASLIRWIREFRDSTRKYGKKPTGSTIHAYLAFMRSFLDYCGVELNWKRITHVAPDARKKSKKRAILIREIRGLYEVMDARGKFAVHFYNSTGARINAINDPRPLTIGDIKRFNVDLDGKIMTIAYVKIYDDDNEEYHAFLSDEALEELDKYLTYRKNLGEDINDASPLFRSEMDTREALKDPEKRTKDLRIRAATTAAINGQFTKGYIAAGMQVRDFKLVHGFRARYKTVLEDSPLKSIFIEALLGHVVNEDDPDGYLKGGPEAIGAKFARYMHLLYVSEVREKSAVIERLETEMDDTVRKHIENQQSELDKVKARMDYLVQTVAMGAVRPPLPQTLDDYTKNLGKLEDVLVEAEARAEEHRRKREAETPVDIWSLVEREFKQDLGAAQTAQRRRNNRYEMTDMEETVKQ